MVEIFKFWLNLGSVKARCWEWSYSRNQWRPIDERKFSDWGHKTNKLSSLSFKNSRFDLTSLAGAEYSVKHGNKSYSFGICQAAKACDQKSGICEKNDTSKAISMGVSNDHLKFDTTGAPYLSYIGGDVCEKPSRQWTTKIEFICGKDGDKGPIMVENTNCTVVIQYKTELVCQTQVGGTFEFCEPKWKIWSHLGRFFSPNETKNGEIFHFETFSLWKWGTER